MQPTTRTTINSNQQEVIRQTEQAGSDHNANIWVLRCRRCGTCYGANSTDAWEHKCPMCQSGRVGLPIPIERDGKDWTREEHIIAFNLYCQIPFGTIHVRNPKILELASLLGRKVGSVSNKLANLARHDPILAQRGVRGLPHGAKGEAEVWREFVDNPEHLAFESARLLAERRGQPITQVAEVEEDDLPPEGLEREAILRVRVNQNFFRRRVLSAYNYRCCVTGLAVPELLVASHIVPWSEDPANRLNPRNGLCLNALHDRVFDTHLMWVEEDCCIRFSPSLRAKASASDAALDWLLRFEGKPLLLPAKFTPASDLLVRHAQKCRSR